MSAVSLKDDGFLTIEIDGIAVNVDVYHANNTLVGLRNSDTLGFHKAVKEYMQSLGFPACSDRLADKFAAAIFEQVSALKKNDGDDPKPASPVTTESIPSS